MNQKQRFLFIKMWFETGQGILSHIKPFLYIIFIKLVWADEWYVILGSAITWLITCIITGYYWYSSGLASEATSIGNKYNPDLQEIKKKVSK